jgi:hypothetical protein
VLELLELPVEEMQEDATVQRQQAGGEGSAGSYGNNCGNVRLGRTNMRRNLQESQEEIVYRAGGNMVQEWLHIARRNTRKTMQQN